MAKEVRRVEIVGAGFAGLAAAAAFAQYGYEVTVHERGPTIRAFGSALALSENALKVLDMLGAYDDAVEGAFPLFNRETQDGDGRLISSYNWKTEDQNLRMFMLLRSRVVEALEKAARRAGATILTSSEAREIDPAGSVTLAGGECRTADLVLVADGAGSRSALRRKLLKRQKWFADGTIRMLVPRQQDCDWPEGTFVEYWSDRRRAMLCPCSPKHLYLGLIAQKGDQRGTLAPIDKETWINTFPVLTDYITRIGEQERWSWDQYQSAILRRWHEGRVAFLGDAAHAMSPNFGQGAALSMVNALSLAATIHQVGDLPSALERWEARERPLVDRTQFLSGIYSSLANWPKLARNSALSMMGRSRWIMKQRTLAAYRIPTGYAPPTSNVST